MTRKEYLQKYYLDNKDKYNAQSKKWYEKNKPRAQFAFRKWCAQNKEYLKKYKNQWYLKKKIKKYMEAGTLGNVATDLVNKFYEDTMNGVKKRGEI